MIFKLIAFQPLGGMDGRYITKYLYKLVFQMVGMEGTLPTIYIKYVVLQPLGGMDGRNINMYKYTNYYSIFRGYGWKIYKYVRIKTNNPFLGGMDGRFITKYIYKLVLRNEI